MIKKQKLTPDEVRCVAKLADLPVSTRQEEKLAEQMEETVNYINHLREVATFRVPPTHQVTGKTNQFRDDIVTPCLSQVETLKNARQTQNGLFVAAKTTWE